MPAHAIRDSSKQVVTIVTKRLRIAIGADDACQQAFGIKVIHAAIFMYDFVSTVTVRK